MDSMSAMVNLASATAAITACVLVGLGVLRGRWPTDRKAAVALYCGLTVIALLWQSPFGRITQTRWGLGPVMLTVGAGTPGAIWLLSAALFEDRRLRPLDLLPTIVSIAILAAMWTVTQGRVIFFGIWIGWSGLVVLHALSILIRSGRDDLVEARRRLRVWLAILMTVGCVVFLLMLARLSAALAGWPLSWAPTVLNGLVAACLIMAAVLLLDARADLFEVARHRTADNGDAELLIRLRVLMSAEEPWREENLGVGDLAARLGAPEYRLRRLIHTQMGHRNFSEFINGYRLDAAQRLLAAPDRTTVAQAAFSVGFASLSPFNRAFKQQTGLTPTAWRKQRLRENSN